MSKTIRVAAAQIAPVFLNRESTVEKVCQTLMDAGRDGAQFIAFPETIIPGYPYWAFVLEPASSQKEFHRKLFHNAVEVPSPTTDILCEAAKQTGCFAVIGLNERDGGTLYNTQLFIAASGEIVGKKRKLVPTSYERMVWGRGDGRDLQVFSTEFGKVGGLICGEHSNALFRYALQAQGEQIHVASWPGGIPAINHNIDVAVRYYAYEAQAFVISVTSLLTEEIIESLGTGESVGRLRPGGGYSFIVDPQGNYLVKPEESKEEVLYADLDFDRIIDAKRIFDSTGHYARPDVVRLHLQRRPQEVVVIEKED